MATTQGKVGTTSNRGFAAMSGEKQREIASKGGQSVPPEKRSFSQNRELAAQAGRKGGEASHGPALKKTDGTNVPAGQERTQAPDTARKGGNLGSGRSQSH